jgi:SAM-dependent methyltransferase
MRRFTHSDRREYERLQIARCRAKFGFCKVPLEDVERYRAAFPTASGPVLCLGVRNGTELNRFRRVFGGTVQGVDLNPDSAYGRKDVWTGSFDALPAEWTDRFGIVFSNAFDHAFDPMATAAEWTRVLRPGGLLILAHGIGALEEPTPTDCIVLDSSDEAQRLFGIPIVGSGQGHYPELYLRKPGRVPVGRHGLPDPEDYVESVEFDVPAWQPLVTVAALAGVVISALTLAGWLRP